MIDDNRFASADTAAQPLYCVVTTFLDDEDRPDAERLGTQLYDQLTRQRSDPLSFGPGIPVAVAAEFAWHDPRRLDVLGNNLLVIVVAGSTSLLLNPTGPRQRIAALAERLNDVAPEGARRRVLVQPNSGRWQGEAGRLKPASLSAAVFRADDPAAVDAALLEIGFQFLGPARPRLFVSHQSQRTIRDRMNQPVRVGVSPLWDYFAAVQDVPQDGLSSIKVTPENVASGVLVVIQDDQQLDRTSWERDVVAAKCLGWPVVSLMVPQNSMRKPSAYTGNVPTISWTKNIDEMLRLVVVQHLRDCHFRQVAARIIDSAKLPINTAVMARAPELLDLTSGVLKNQSIRTLLHPDPALSQADREVLRSAAPELQPITPSTILAKNPARTSKQELTSPLDGLRVGVSVSDIHPNEFRSGQTPFHLEDATVQVARTLISGGASLCYGGDFSLGRVTSFTPLFAEIIQTYGQTYDQLDDKLCIFRAANQPLEAIPEEMRCRIRHVGRSADLARDSLIKVDEEEEFPSCLFTSDMRRAMIAETDARIVLGGQSLPSGEETPGYCGRFPGIAEEVYLALQRNQPVYLCGGLGGITYRLAGVLASPFDLDPFWHEALHSSNRRFVKLCWDVEQHPLTRQLGLPRTLWELIQSVAAFFRRLGSDDAAWFAWNGLTRQQNLSLSSTTDPLLISSLVGEGLIQWRISRLKSDGKQRIEAVLGDVASASASDVLALPVFSDVDPQGAGAVIDRLTGGLVSQGRERPGRIVAVRNEHLDVDYLCIVSLGAVSSYKENHLKLRDVVVQRTRELVALCQQEEFKTLAIVTFAGSTLRRYEDAVNAMLDGLSSAGSDLTVKWLERSPDKYATLVETIRKRSSVSLTTVTLAPTAGIQTVYPWFHLTVKWFNDRLDVTALPSSGNGLAWSRPTKLTQSNIDDLARGANGLNVTPSFSELLQRGSKLADVIFGEHASTFFAADPDAAIAITHDAESSRLPFELLQFASDGNVTHAPACRGGIHRLLAVDEASPSSVYARPKLTHRLRIGLVIDPTRNLPGAAAEGEALATKLTALAGDIHVTVLRGSEATLDAMTGLMMQVDVLHYCGHAFFDPQTPSASGLLLANDQRLTAAELRAIGSVPRVVVLNACQAARVRGNAEKPVADAYSLANMLLRSGVEAFVGTFWEVSDASATEFSAAVYQSLTSGETLRASVTRARNQLVKKQLSDWGNYLLYGDGRFRLM